MGRSLSLLFNGLAGGWLVLDLGTKVARPGRIESAIDGFAQGSRGIVSVGRDGRVVIPASRTVRVACRRIYADRSSAQPGCSE